MSKKDQPGLLAKAFSESLRKAERYTADPQRLSGLAAKVQHKMDTNKIALKTVGESMRDTADDLSVMGRMARAYGKRNYRRIPWGALAMIAGALVYFITPTDAIPDFILGLGLVDDATIIALVAKSLATVIEEFRRWEAQQPPQLVAADLTELPSAGSAPDAAFEEIPVNLDRA
jgi:uncharacterized membrane protein YkvA (DUF1232 family)